MVVYEGWKAFKRNPPTSVYNPRSFGLCMLTYVTFSVATEIARPYYHGMHEWNEHHTHDYNEQMRQYKNEKSLEFRNYILDQRKAQDERLRQQAQQN